MACVKSFMASINLNNKSNVWSGQPWFHQNSWRRNEWINTLTAWKANAFKRWERLHKSDLTSKMRAFSPIQKNNHRRKHGSFPKFLNCWSRTPSNIYIFQILKMKKFALWKNGKSVVKSDQEDVITEITKKYCQWKVFKKGEYNGTIHTTKKVVKCHCW